MTYNNLKQQNLYCGAFRAGFENAMDKVIHHAEEYKSEVDTIMSNQAIIKILQQNGIWEYEDE